MSKKHPAIKVASAKEGFRRAGHVFGIVPKTIALAALHPDAHAAIVADKSLVVVDTAIHLPEDEAAALPHRHAAHVTAALANADALTLDVSEDDAKRALALADIEADLKAREKVLDGREQAVEEVEAELIKSTAEFDERCAGLVTRENDLLAREQAFEASQAAAASGKAASTSGKGRG
ncbi:hypothetical protein BLA13014_03784 [Burkholderia aenigmatica]|uniref:Uncharacterized protein n=1 Tax=Burkholderia aenigmatica TaxID=2015348 RepID=A0A6P2MP20_9BURK|nr:MULTISPECIES: hypothetical protein [Burkholderia]VWB82163.1 hypothetical protein BLA13014_03784 [Burkholderia aenigmatica]